MKLVNQVMLVALTQAFVNEGRRIVAHKQLNQSIQVIESHYIALLTNTVDAVAQGFQHSELVERG